jgi:3-oxoacyl-(acyl-carrier-protein) synthase
VYYDLKTRQRDDGIDPQPLMAPPAAQPASVKTPAVSAAGIVNAMQDGMPQADLDDFVKQAVLSCLGAERAGSYTALRPLMEMGLDSAGLAMLAEQIQQRYGARVPSTFFFEHSTPARIVDALQSVSTAKRGAVPEEEKARGEEQREQNGSCPKGSCPVPALMNGKPDTRQAGDSHAVKRVAEDRIHDIAIIGMACRLPGGINDPDALWQLLATGGNAIGELPSGRWQWPEGMGPQQYPGIERGGFLEDIAAFDAGFFRISPREAELMDPQQRLLLELSWQTLEDAGYSHDQLAGSATGVFVGVSGSDYQKLLSERRIPVQAHSGLGSAMAILANRISYFYDWHGPSLGIDTACSSSLVALVDAVQSLRNGQCAQALVAGIHLMIHPDNSLAYYQAGMLAPDGQCKPFDHRANGYVRSEGAVAVLLKPLTAAIRDGDTIAAVIKGVACNHGGQASGLTVPNPTRQAQLLRQAWRDAGIEGSALGYLEAHGTGTPLGDPIEIRGIEEAQTGAGDTTSHSPCVLGSIKANLGHLEAAAGLAGVLRAVLCLQHKAFLPQANFDTLNPHITLEGSRLRIAHHESPRVL